MDKPWAELPTEEKKEKRAAWFLTTEGINFTGPEAEKNYKTRAQRLLDVYNVREPDRVPVSIPVGFMPAYQAGIDLRTAMYDPAKAVEAWAAFNRNFELDFYASAAAVPPGEVMEALGYKMYLWPGHGLPADATGFQFVEGEYMTADEYDDLIRDPSDFWIRRYLPRVFGALEPFKTLAPLTNINEIVHVIPAVMPFTRPEARQSLQALIDAGKELEAWNEVIAKMNRRGLELGFPVARQVFAKAPFDIIGDTLRGTQGIMMDMYRRPEKLLKALEAVTEFTIAATLAQAQELRALLVMFPLHKGADGWMSEEQFKKFYWPYLKRFIDALVADGLIVSLFAEGSYNTRLELVNEFPKGSVSWLFDQTDMARAKQVLGNNCCIAGNVPSSMLFSGAPQEVKEYCRKLIEVCGQGGGFILAPGCVDVAAKPENINAMMEAAREYGTYRQ
jgi:uroporphyrinogen-III decarboxylase